MPARTLTILVVVMGVMILAGFAVLGAMIAVRMSHPSSSSASLRPFAAAPIALPAGARVEAISAGTDRLVIDIALADGDRQLVIIDLATGRRLGTVPLHTAR